MLLWTNRNVLDERTNSFTFNECGSTSIALLRCASPHEQINLSQLKKCEVLNFSNFVFTAFLPIHVFCLRNTNKFTPIHAMLEK